MPRPSIEGLFRSHQNKIDKITSIPTFEDLNADGLKIMYFDMLDDYLYAIEVISRDVTDDFAHGRRNILEKYLLTLHDVSNKIAPSNKP